MTPNLSTDPQVGSEVTTPNQSTDPQAGSFDTVEVFSSEEEDTVPDLDEIEKEVLNNTDAYLESVCPENLPSRPSTPSTMVSDTEGIIEVDDSDEESSGDEGIPSLVSPQSVRSVHHLNSSSSSDSDLEAIISRRELLALEQRIFDEGETPETSDSEAEANVPGSGMSRPDSQVNFLLLEETFEIEQEVDNFEPDWTSGQTGFSSYHQRTLGKELLINLLTRMIHYSNDLFDVFVTEEGRRSNGGEGARSSFDENWPRGLTIPEMILAYENAYKFISEQPEAKEMIEKNGFYHPVVFHNLGRRRIYFGQTYNRAPPPGTPAQTLWRDLQPVVPTFVPETPETLIPETPEPAPMPEVNAIPTDVGMQYELNLGLLNGRMEANNVSNVEWAHGVLDAEESTDPEGVDLNDDPFGTEAPEPLEQTYRKSLRQLLVRLILRADRITLERNKKLHDAAIGLRRHVDPQLDTQWFANCGKRLVYVDLLSRYDEIVDETNFLDQHNEAVKAQTASAVQHEHIQDFNAAKAHAAKINANVRHYFSKCEDGQIVVNYEYVGPSKTTLIGEPALREFSRLTALGYQFDSEVRARFDPDPDQICSQIVSDLTSSLSVTSELGAGDQDERGYFAVAIGGQLPPPNPESFVPEELQNDEESWEERDGRELINNLNAEFFTRGSRWETDYEPDFAPPNFEAPSYTQAELDVLGLRQVNMAMPDVIPPDSFELVESDQEE